MSPASIERLAIRTPHRSGNAASTCSFRFRFSTAVKSASAQAAETYNQAFNLLTEKAVNVRSEARDAFRVYRSTYDIAGHYQREVLPLRKIISDEMQLRFGSMQVDVFALLTEARQRIAALRAAIEAKRDFWLAQSELQTAINGGGRGESQPETRSSTTAQASGGGH